MKLTVNGLAVSPVLGAVRLEKSREDAASSLTAVLWTAPADTYFQKLSLAVGDVVRLVDDTGTERFLGSVHCIRREAEKVTLTAFDRGVYLARNEVYGVFAGTGADICRQVAAKLGIGVGTLDACPDYQVITALSGENAFALLRRAAGKGREVSMQGTALTVRPTGTEVLSLPPERVLEVSAAADIREVVNRCVVVDRKGHTLATAKNEGDIQTYGLFQTVLGRSDDPNRQARSALQGRRMSAGVTLLGDLRFQVGSRVSARQSRWGLDGTYTVTALCHRWEAGVFTTELTLEGDA